MNRFVHENSTIAALNFHEGWILDKAMRIGISAVFRSKWMSPQAAPQRQMRGKMQSDMYHQNMHHFNAGQRHGNFQHMYVPQPQAHHHNRMPSWQGKGPGPDAKLDSHLKSLPAGIANQFTIPAPRQSMGEDSLAQSKPPAEEAIHTHTVLPTSQPERPGSDVQTRVSLPAAKSGGRQKKPEQQSASEATSRVPPQDQTKSGKKNPDNKLPKKVNASNKLNAPPASLPEKPAFTAVNRQPARDTATPPTGPAPKDKRQLSNVLPTITEREPQPVLKENKPPNPDAKPSESQPAPPKQVFKSAIGDPSTEPFIYKGNRVGISTIGKKNHKKNKRPEIPTFAPRDLERRGG